MLRSKVNELIPQSKRNTLVSLSPTRWVQRWESLLAFKQLFLPVVEALRLLAEKATDNVPGDLVNGLCTRTCIDLNL